MSKYQSSMNDEEYTQIVTQKILAKEKEKWNREQRHMEGQILNVIDTTRKIQTLLQKEEKTKKLLALGRQKRKEELVASKLVRDKRREKNYERARENYKKKQKELKKSQLIAKKRAFKGRKRVEESLRMSKHGNRSIPEFIQMKEKTMQYHMQNEIAEEVRRRQIEDQMEKIEEKEMIVYHNLEVIRNQKQSTLDKAMKRVEENKKKAQDNFRIKNDKLANDYIQKLVGIKEKEEKKKLLKAQELLEREEKYQKALKSMKANKKKNYQHKKEKLHQYLEKKERGIENMRNFLKNQKKMIKLRRKKNNEREEEVKNNYQNNLMQSQIEGLQLMAQINQKYDRIKEKKEIRENMLEERKKMLEDLAGKKDEFKNSFALFNTVSDNNQKKAIGKLKSYGLKNRMLIDRLKEIEEEEQERIKEELKKKAKAEEDEFSSY